MKDVQCRRDRARQCRLRALSHSRRECRSDRAETRLPAARGRGLQPVRSARRHCPTCSGDALRTADWREVVAHPEVDIVAELVGGTGVAREIIDGAIANGKSIVTANKELMALCGAEIWDRAIKAEHQSGDGSERGGRHSDPRRAARRHFGRPHRRHRRHSERHQQLHPDRDGAARRHRSTRSWRKRRRWGTRKPTRARMSMATTRARSWRFFRRWRSASASRPSDIFVEGIRRITAQDFEYAHQLGHTIRLVCSAHADGARADSFRAARADSGNRRFWPACRARTTPSG